MYIVWVYIVFAIGVYISNPVFWAQYIIQKHSPILCLQSVSIYPIPSFEPNI